MREDAKAEAQSDSEEDSDPEDLNCSFGICSDEESSGQQELPLAVSESAPQEEVLQPKENVTKKRRRSTKTTLPPTCYEPPPKDDSDEAAKEVGKRQKTQKKIVSLGVECCEKKKSETNVKVTANSNKVNKQNQISKRSRTLKEPAWLKGFEKY